MAATGCGYGEGGCGTTRDRFPPVKKTIPSSVPSSATTLSRKKIAIVTGSIYRIPIRVAFWAIARRHSTRVYTGTGRRYIRWRHAGVCIKLVTVRTRYDGRRSLSPRCRVTKPKLHCLELTASKAKQRHVLGREAFNVSSVSNNSVFTYICGA